ncbi:MAG: hypothetical protein FWE42_00725 [Defluviitaleaceae bacterium]|nr:hypothetical protein [Defluviitaleaceae bacterium]
MIISDYLCKQLAVHPSIQAQDVIKLCFQAAFGAEHLLGDIGQVRGYFDAEYERVEARNGPVAEFICEDVCRVNLAAWKMRKLPADWLFNLFVQSAKMPMKKAEDRFRDYIAQAEALNNEWGGFFRDYHKDGIKPVHHSQLYKENEHPAYRVISGQYVRLIPIFNDMKELPKVIAIDGRAASGKTTMASQLAEVTGAGVVHMDDFFLPKELRTPERFAQSGGNIHHERFSHEVLPFLHSGEAFGYGIFDCNVMDINKTREVIQSPLQIVEGAYSCHPVLGGYMDMRIFSDISPDEQIKRVEVRNGPEIAMVYATRWIPMEEAYLQAYRVKDSADVVVS